MIGKSLGYLNIVWFWPYDAGFFRFFYFVIEIKIKTKQVEVKTDC